ncbi:1a70feec-8597-4cc5-bf72-22614090ec30 [Thermothielavioides terrestris]|uniref:1a70feec-8597-4cc5-bf72-22614090ec30 n=1 Tax=Thermothielavioides terrestris TaxID=2587410 RepID=A0A446BME5_9PEZI|nr:1a70feec-8597-4cc5-bf72-22614090ec30 [Thermothielavioides terrestris]
MEVAPAEPSIGSDLVPFRRISPQPEHSGTVEATPPNSAAADAGSEAPVNPRKRKKASRACDFCHVNHQPCDNGKPKCSVCTKHNKPCLYLRPTKRRGPQKGYRTALNTYKESAAAWGAVLAAIPGLDALIEGHLRGAAGKGVVASIKDSNQQEALIARWQESSVFRAFFGHNGPPPGLQPADSNSAAPSHELEDEDAGDETPPARPPPAARPSQSQPPASKRSRSVSSFVVLNEATRPPPSLASAPQPKDSLSDIVAKDAAQSATRASQTLASLGFAPDETIADFYSMGSNPEPIPERPDPDFDPSLGSEAEQRAYYELLMGRSFPG